MKRGKKEFRSSGVAGVQGVAENALECSLKPIAAGRLAFPCDK
jgi:hypothetical protein